MQHDGIIIIANEIHTTDIKKNKRGLWILGIQILSRIEKFISKSEVQGLKIESVRKYLQMRKVLRKTETEISELS